MLMPESGASTVMYAATRHPATTPVIDACREALTNRTVSMSTNEMPASAATAAPTPPSPGAVTTKCTAGCITALGQIAYESSTPRLPPASCART
jgi:hypothetical protein